MSIVTAVVFSMFLLTVTGCVTSSPPPAAKQETGKKDFSSFSGDGPGFESSAGSPLWTVDRTFRTTFRLFPPA